MSVLWTVATGATAVVIGLVVSNLVLIAFGLTATIDAAGSWALVLHFRHVRQHDRVDTRRERRAHLVINVGLVAVGAGAVAESVDRLVRGAGGHGSAAGAAIAAASVCVLPVLAVRKRQLARRLASAPLRADGNLSATGALLGVVTVVGALVHGVDWLDPVCAMAIGVVAAGSGVYSLVSNDGGG